MSGHTLRSESTMKPCKRCGRQTLGWAPSGSEGGCDYCPSCVAVMLAEDDAAIEAAYAAGAERDPADDPREYEAESDPKKYDQD